MMAFTEEDDTTELTESLLSNDTERKESMTLHVTEDEKHEEDFEFISTRETLVFDEQYMYQHGSKGAHSDTFFQKYLMSKMQPGSLKGSMFTMTVAIVGAGVLSLPYAVDQAGFVLGLLMIAFTAAITNFSLRLLVTCSELANSRSYMDLAKNTGGSALANFTQTIVCMNLFGTCVGYLVGSSELIQLASKAFFKDEHFYIIDNRQALLLTLTCIFILPLSLFRSLKSLRFTSLFSIVCIVFMTIVVVIKYFEFVHLGFAPSMNYQLHHLPLFNWEMDRLLKAIPLVIFAYTCHPNVLPIYLVLKRRSDRRMHKVLNRSISLAALVYILCGGFVVLTFGNTTKSNFLKNNYHQGAAIVTGCIGFSIALLLTVPLFIHTLRENLQEAFVVALVLIVALLVGDIATVLSFLGCTTNPVICFVLPAYFIVKIGSSSYKIQKIFAIALASFACAISIVCLYHQLN